ncbi:KH domain-containing, RNA-binding, signal transduction-associated protein 2 [Eumeta japonica]|uniref:KH domain-containing, RNA-binding, signal transduction-associated protein 2 n=1 Tax=Eumeta variegata TaxID=151549 RepID=A0A4C1YCG9_EUMVA|nr:KH domain-containing, RNA-binding, signal transduction-associated protein 2 [Eumeta japonica]
MGDKYQKNYGGGDFKRNALQEHNESEQDEGEEGVKLNDKAGEYMRELLSEKIKMDHLKFPLLTNLVDQEVTRVQATGRIPPRDQKYVDVYREKSIKVVAKVLVPIKEHPKFNFVGKLLGPKGNTLKQLQEDTMCKMAVLGRGSMRDRQKEEEFRSSLDPKYAHLSDELHVEISALGPPAEAHARMAYALAEIRKYLIPDSNDFIRQNQMREIIDRRPRAPPPPPPPHRAPPITPRVMPAKAKVISILDRARSAMEESYGYEESYDVREPPVNMRMEWSRGSGFSAGSADVYFLQVRGVSRAPEPDYYGYDRSERYYEEEAEIAGASGGRGGEYKAAGHARSMERAPRTAAVHGARHYARASPYSRPPK